MPNLEFIDLLRTAWPDLNDSQAAKVASFYDLVVVENEIQNLTRLISPVDFIAGHVSDVVELLKTGYVEYTAMDLGSGAGVPGLICAIKDSQRWVLTDSEGRKAEFLKKTAKELDLPLVEGFSGRAEDYLKSKSVGTIVARAVGPVSRIFSWIERCSTWNNLVLLKGPGWDAEWEEFQVNTKRKKLSLTSKHIYEVGAEKKQRVIVKLNRL